MALFQLSKEGLNTQQQQGASLGQTFFTTNTSLTTPGVYRDTPNYHAEQE